MLTKKDLSQIEEVIKKSISEAFHDFYENIFAPYVERNDRHHKEIVSKILEIEKGVNTLKNDMEDVKEYIKDHDKRIENLEAVVRVRN